MFSKNWHGPHIKEWEVNLNEFKNKPSLRFLEIGTFEGMACAWLCENYLTHDNSKIDVIDAFEFNFGYNDEKVDREQIKNRFLENTRKFGNKIRLFEGRSVKELPRLIWIDKSYHFIYIDGSHKSFDIMTDAVLSLMLLRSNGLLMFDDYKWGEKLEKYLQPKTAIDSFIDIYREFISEVKYQGNQVLIRKK